MSGETVIEYRPTEEAWAGHDAFLQRLILDNRCRTVCEIGGGANPALSREFVEQHGITYVIVDISEEELRKAPHGYVTRVMDVGSAFEHEVGNYDLVFSKMLAEHIRDGRAFHRNMFQLLRDGGLAFHFFPTLYAFPFIANRLLPERLGYRVLRLLQPGRDRAGRNAKFPAYYSWCRGPMRRQFRRLESVGFDVLTYIGFFGHDTYYNKFPIFAVAHRWLSGWLLRHPAPWATSFAYVVLRKVGTTEGWRSAVSPEVIGSCIITIRAVIGSILIIDIRLGLTSLYGPFRNKETENP